MAPRSRERKEPVRTCVACRATAGKQELVRIVVGPRGGPSIDPTGKAPGRGAYVHADPACWRVALRRGQLARALRTTLRPEEAGTLLEALEGAPKEL